MQLPHRPAQKQIWGPPGGAELTMQVEQCNNIHILRQNLKHNETRLTIT